MHKSKLLGAVYASIFAFVITSTHAASYSIIDLGSLAGVDGASIGFALNNNGQVTGISQLNTSVLNRAFLYDGSTMLSLGTLGGTESRGHGINDSGQVVGSSDIIGDGTQHAFLYDGTILQDLGTLGGDYSGGADINNSGSVVGTSSIDDDSAPVTYHAFVYDGSTMQDLGTLGGMNSSGSGINESGQVVGSSNITGYGAYHAFLYDGNTMLDLGTLGGEFSFGQSINDSGFVTGYSNVTGNEILHAFIYDGATMRDLGTLDGFTESYGWDINNSGQVVGSSEQFGGGSGGAFLYDGNSMLDLCVLVDCVNAGWDSLSDAFGINDNGDITGLGYINGQLRAFLIVANQPPLADAGSDQTVHIGSIVSLNGVNSSDPDEGYPLTYEWSLAYGETNVTSELSDPTVVDPTFTASQLGYDYIATLVVTDSEGNSSHPDAVIISTGNTRPVADAGPDQVINLIGTYVTLNGSNSYDNDGDNITYDWILTKPSGSGTALSDPYSATPSFTADVNGDYTATLVVHDGYADSDPESVLVSFANVAPVANAGGNQAVTVGDEMTLSGSGSDANGDPLVYQWSFVSIPSESGATLQGANTATATFTADTSGTYVVSLVVNDGKVDSAPSNVTVVASSAPSQVIDRIDEIIKAINDLPPVVLKNPKLANPLTNKLIAVIAMIDAGEYLGAYDKLSSDVIVKSDGCAKAGMPDRNDWIETCDGQSEVYPLILQALALLEELLGI